MLEMKVFLDVCPEDKGNREENIYISPPAADIGEHLASVAIILTLSKPKVRSPPKGKRSRSQVRKFRIMFCWPVSIATAAALLNFEVD